MSTASLVVPVTRLWQLTIPLYTKQWPLLIRRLAKQRQLTITLFTQLRHLMGDT